MKKKHIILIIRAFVLVLTSYIIYMLVDLNLVLSLFKDKFPINLLIFIILIVLFRNWLNAYRWEVLNVNTKNQLSRWDYFRYVMISNTYKMVLPGVLGGDVVKAIWISSDDKENSTNNVLSIISDRLVGMLSIIILSFSLIMPSNYFSNDVKQVFTVFFLLFFLMFFIITYLIKTRHTKIVLYLRKTAKSKIIKFIKRNLQNAIEIYLFFTKNPLIILKGLFISMVIHLINFFINFLIADFLELGIGFFDIAVISSAVWLITVLPISISGIGVRELSFIFLLAGFGVSKEMATVMSLYIFSISIIFAILGLPFLLTKKKPIK